MSQPQFPLSPFVPAFPTSPLPQIHSPSVSSTEKNRVPRDESQTGQSKIKSNKTKALISKLDKSTQEKEKSTKNRQESQKYPHSHCRPTKHQANSHKIIAEDMVQIHTGPMLSASVSVSPCELTRRT